MTPQQKMTVQLTFSKLTGETERLAERFYARLFEIDPSARPLFTGTDMREQGKKLIQMLSVAVSHLDRLDQVVPALEQLGRRHVGYGVEEAHYASVGEALLEALGDLLGEDFTPAARASWAETYRILAETMTSAAAEGRATA